LDELSDDEGQADSEGEAMQEDDEGLEKVRSSSSGMIRSR
jgi:hypothetical protein